MEVVFMRSNPFLHASLIHLISFFIISISQKTTQLNMVFGTRFQAVNIKYLFKKDRQKIRNTVYSNCYDFLITLAEIIRHFSLNEDISENLCLFTI